MSEKIDRISSIKLDEPTLEEIGNCFHSSLAKNFKEVSINVIDCPDLSLEPWKLSSKSIGGIRRIADVGGVDNLHYIENNSKTFLLEEVAKTVGLQGGFVMGPGAGSIQQTGGMLTELMADSNLSTGDIHSKFCKVTENGGYKLEDYKSNEIGVLANLLVCEGHPCKVIHVKCSERNGELNFVTCLRKALDESFKDKSVGIAGIFEIKKGKIRAHVMPDFPRKDMLSRKVVEEWLQFYEMKAPLICLSVFISNDKQNLGLRLEHTHFYSAHGDGGHYHFDTTPSEVEYEGYFVICEAAYRLNPPVLSKDRKEFFQN